VAVIADTSAPLASAPEETRARAGAPLAELDCIQPEHFEFVWRSLRRLGVWPAELDDAAQDVFIVFLRRQAEFQGQSSYRTWLFGIASNVAHEYRRKRQRAERMAPVSDSYEQPGVSPLERATNAQALRFVDRFLTTLDEDKRNVFILAELEQMSAPEIASALSVKLNTVYSRLRVARPAFFDMLQRDPEGVP